MWVVNSGISTVQSAWNKNSDTEQGTQIDHIIERRDNVVNMCEIKFFSNKFIVTESYHETLMQRIELL